MAKDGLQINIGKNHKPFIVAEISANHKQSISRVFKMIDEAKKCNASAIKLQTYKADKITLNIKNKNFFINDKKSLWKNRYLYELYKEGEMPWEWTYKIFNYARQKKIICFSTPFDESAVDLLEQVNCPIYKIASFELTDYILLEKVAKTKKPVILSTGMATKKEIKDSIGILKKNGSKKIILLKCTSVYPAKIEDLNLLTINDLKKTFKCNIGYSDHSEGIIAATTAVSIGADVIEKHFTLSKKDGALDSKFSADPEELKNLVEACNNAKKALGVIHYGPSVNEKNSIKKRRSLYFISNLKKNDIIKKNDIGSFRPALGIDVKYYKKIIGKRLIKKTYYGQPVKKNFFKK